jgi:hypothetical protein
LIFADGDVARNHDLLELQPLIDQKIRTESHLQKVQHWLHALKLKLEHQDHRL